MSLAKKSIARLLSLAPMLLAVHIGAAAAANPWNDRAEDLRALLSGRPVIASAPASAPRSSKAARSIGDAQQEAREVVLAIPAGTPSARVPDAAQRERGRTRGDAQAQARQVILGSVGVPKVGA
jgi:hypothetical protein